MAVQITQNVTKQDILEGIEIAEGLDQDDEIGNLARSFTTMVEQLRDQQKKKK